MRRIAGMGLSALVLWGVWLRLGAAPMGAPFGVVAPERMVTGRVLLHARTTDDAVETVRWQVDDVTYTTARPFDFVLDLGAIPHEKRVVAAAFDRYRQLLYQQEVLLNSGGQGLTLDVLAPLQGQRTSGPQAVLAKASAPPGDRIVSALLDQAGRTSALREENGHLSGEANIPPEATVLVLSLKTERGRSLEKTVLLNGRGLSTTLEAHAVDQTVGVYAHGEPVEDLKPADFSVRDERGPCEIRDVRLVRDTPLFVGVAIDTSLSLLHTEALRQTAADQFLEKTLKPRDLAFLQRFGQAAIPVLDWTSAKNALQENVRELGYDSLAGTVLHEAVVKALYEFQGGGGARALVLITDGNAYEDDVSEADALEYARASGVKIYALGLPFGQETRTKVQRKAADGTWIETQKVTVKMMPANKAVLDRFTQATGGRTFLIEKAEDLPTAFTRIERAIRTQYLVSYVSNARKRGAFHPVQVKTTRGRVETAAGFFY